LDAEFCVEALKEALATHGPPETFNTDQGSQFTSSDWIEALTDAKIKMLCYAKRPERCITPANPYTPSNTAKPVSVSNTANQFTVFNTANPYTPSLTANASTPSPKTQVLLCDDCATHRL
jgi:hypothetical protein